MSKFPITPDGFLKLESELKILITVERPNVIKAIAEAREHGDLSENAEYSAAREKQGFIEGRIAQLEDMKARADIIDPAKLSGDSVKFGAKLVLYDEDTEEEVSYQIVGEYEADIDNGMIAITAPISRALIGKSEGDNVVVKTPGGDKNYEIVEVIYE